MKEAEIKLIEVQESHEMKLGYICKANGKCICQMQKNHEKEKKLMQKQAGVSGVKTYS